MPRPETAERPNGSGIVPPHAPVEDNDDVPRFGVQGDDTRALIAVDDKHRERGMATSTGGASHEGLRIVDLGRQRLFTDLEGLGVRVLPGA